MKPYYEDESSTIFHGDCIEVLRGIGDGAVDISVTSPPYNLNKKASGGGTSKRDYSDWYADEMPERAYRAWQTTVLEELCRVCKSSIFYNHRIRYAWHSRNNFRTPSNIYHPLDWLKDFPIWCEIVWYRSGTTGHGNGRFRLADERIYQIKKPTLFNDDGVSTVWTILPERDSEHPCPFPVEIPTRCITSTTSPNDCVIDPFCGSGTTLIAAKRLGRRSIGIEREEKYCEMAAKRMFEQEPVLPEPTPTKGE